MSGSVLFGKESDRKVMGTEEAHAVVIQDMLETKELKAKTMSDLNDEEIGILALMQTIGNALKIEELQEFVLNFAQFRVSRGRMGRREMKDIISYSGSGNEDMRRRRSVGDLFAGIKAR